MKTYRDKKRINFDVDKAFEDAGKRIEETFKPDKDSEYTREVKLQNEIESQIKPVEVDECECPCCVNKCQCCEHKSGVGTGHTCTCRCHA